MTVLGNIVAVTSIIAVVSLIQGLNASVKEAILNQAGADAFVIQRFPITRSDDDFDKVRYNPLITLQDMRAIQRYGGENIAAVMADNQGSARITYRDKSIDNTQVTGVTSGYINFSGYDAERGRLMSPSEVDSQRAVVDARLADGGSVVRGEHRSARQDHSDRRRPFPRHRREREEGDGTRSVAGLLCRRSARTIPTCCSVLAGRSS